MAELRLREAEREVALGEARSVLALVREEGRRAQLSALAAAAEEGSLGAGEQATLEGLLELGLQTGRIRALYGPGGEQAALSLYRRLPRGAELEASARAVSDALEALRGLPLQRVELRALGPGAFALSLAAGGSEVSVRLDRQGARVASLGV